MAIISGTDPDGSVTLLSGFASAPPSPLVPPLTASAQTEPPFGRITHLASLARLWLAARRATGSATLRPKNAFRLSERVAPPEPDWNHSNPLHGRARASRSPPGRRVDTGSPWSQL